MIDLQAALQQPLLDVAVAQRVAQVPGDRLDDERGLEVPALEVAAGLSFSLRARALRIMGRLRGRSGKLGGYVNDRERRRSAFATGPSPGGGLGAVELVAEVVGVLLGREAVEEASLGPRRLAQVLGEIGPRDRPG